MRWVAWGLLLASCAPAAVAAQNSGKTIIAPRGDGKIEARAIYCDDGTGKTAACGAPGSPMTTAGRQERAQLVTANVPAGAQAVYGGNYLFDQACSAYGTITLRTRGADGATMVTVLSRSAGDMTMVALGSGATVDATVSGTTGCNAALSRVPQ